MSLNFVYECRCFLLQISMNAIARVCLWTIVAIILTTATLMQTVPTLKAPSSARVIRDTLEMGSLAWVRNDISLEDHFWSFVGKQQ